MHCVIVGPDNIGILCTVCVYTYITREIYKLYIKRFKEKRYILICIYDKVYTYMFYLHRYLIWYKVPQQAVILDRFNSSCIVHILQQKESALLLKLLKKKDETKNFLLKL